MKINHSKLKSFFIGTLLGDSYIHNGCFECKQISKDLIEFKAKFIKQYLPDAYITIKEYSEYIDKNGINHQKYYILRASKSKYIKKLEKVFYPNGIKIYPKNSVLKLDSLGFAMWYADDGTSVLVQYNSTTKSARARRVQLCTDNFTFHENEQIKKDLEQLGYNIKIVNRHRNNQVRIQINTPYQKFLCSISSYFYNYFPSLLYKIDLGYRDVALLNRKYVSEDYYKCYLKISAHPSFIDRIKDRMI